MAGPQDEPTVLRLGIGPGTRLNGIYEIERLIAIGGMGEVYKGRAIQTGDPVAIKTIRPELARNEAALTLFRKEAAALHNLHHEAIVRYFVFTVDPDLGAPYLAMEYVDGQPLSEMLKRGPLGYDAARILQRRLAGGLQAAHGAGIVHRDVSVDNIILPAGDVARAKIIDFGIARTSLLGEATVIGAGFAGKYSCASPEQLGLHGGDVGAPSDVYSLGLILAHALSGRPLDMGGSQVEVVEKRRKVPDLSGIDARMRPLLERMLQPKPSDRIASMAEVAAWEPPARAPARRALPVAIGGLAAAAALAGAVMLVAPRVADPVVPDPQPAGPAISAVAPPPTGAGPASGGAEVQPAPGPILPTPPEPSASRDPPPQPASQDPPPQPTPQDPPPPTEQQTAQLHGPARIPRDDAVQPASLLRVDRLAQYVRDYPGGECFFLTPTSLTPTSASIEGFGLSTAAFEAFDRDFQKANGFEAQISLRSVAEAQCPAVAFMRLVGVNAERAPSLKLEAYNLRNTEPLSGVVENLGGRHVDVLLVSDDGYVRSLTDYMKQENGAAMFNLRLRGISSQRPKPQIVLAIASAKPLALLATGKPIAADALFPLLLDEARSQGMTLDVAVKYFRIEG